uniref:Alpha/beta hydrolase n=1 Tax=Strongyloides venezuelensis TaxID=75913 RepID=A0A0K0F086_STRVS
MVIQDDRNKEVIICKNTKGNVSLNGDEFMEFTESLLQDCSCSFNHHTSTSKQETFINKEDKKVNDILSIITSDTDYKKLSIISNKFNTFNYNVPKRYLFLTEGDQNFLNKLKYFNKYEKCSCIKNGDISSNDDTVNIGCSNGKMILWNFTKNIKTYFKKYFDDDILCQKVWKAPLNEYYMIKNLPSINKLYNILPKHSGECFLSMIKYFLIPISNNGSISGSYVLVNSNPKYTIIYSHSENSNLYHYTQIFPNIQSIASFLNVNFVTYDYSGYGISTGTPSVENLQETLKAIIKYVNTDLGIKKDQIILWGSSLGGTLSADIMLNEKDLRGLILYDTPNTMLEYLCYKDKQFNYQKYQKYSKYRKDFNTLDVVSKINVPTLILRNQYNANVSYVACFKIYKAIKKPVPCFTIYDNNDLFFSRETLWRVKEYLEYDIN